MILKFKKLLIILFCAFFITGCYPGHDTEVVTVKGIILFQSDRPEGAGQSIFMLKDGEIRTVLPGLNPKAYDDGRKVMYWNGALGGLSVADVKDPKKIELDFMERYKPFEFDVSPEGNTIVFTSDMDERFAPYNLYSIDIDGSDLKQLTNFTVNTEWPIGSPSISPDGKRVVFEAPKKETDPKSPTSLYMMNINGTDMKELFGKEFRGGIEAAWSPDMKELTFVWTVDGYRNLFTVDLSTLQVNQLTDFNEKNFGHAYNPCYSPDGKQICFALKLRGVTAGQELFAINSDGTNLIRLTPAKKISRYPGWVTDKHPDWIE